MRQLPQELRLYPNLKSSRSSTSYGPPIKRPAPQPQPAPKPTSRRGLLGAIGAAACAGGALLIPGKAAATQAAVDDSRTARNAEEAELLRLFRAIDVPEIDDGTAKARALVVNMIRGLVPNELRHH